MNLKMLGPGDSFAGQGLVRSLSWTQPFASFSESTLPQQNHSSFLSSSSRVNNLTTNSVLTTNNSNNTQVNKDTEDDYRPPVRRASVLDNVCASKPRVNCASSLSLFPQLSPQLAPTIAYTPPITYTPSIAPSLGKASRSSTSSIGSHSLSSDAPSFDAPSATTAAAVFVTLSSDRTISNASPIPLPSPPTRFRRVCSRDNMHLAMGHSPINSCPTSPRETSLPVPTTWGHLNLNSTLMPRGMMDVQHADVATVYHMPSSFVPDMVNVVKPVFFMPSDILVVPPHLDLQRTSEPLLVHNQMISSAPPFKGISKDHNVIRFKDPNDRVYSPVHLQQPENMQSDCFGDASSCGSMLDFDASPASSSLSSPAPPPSLLLQHGTKPPSPQTPTPASQQPSDRVAERISRAQQLASSCIDNNNNNNNNNSNVVGPEVSPRINRTQHASRVAQRTNVHIATLTNTPTQPSSTTTPRHNSSTRTTTTPAGTSSNAPTSTPSKFTSISSNARSSPRDTLPSRFAQAPRASPLTIPPSSAAKQRLITQSPESIDDSLSDDDPSRSDGQSDEPQGTRARSNTTPLPLRSGTLSKPKQAASPQNPQTKLSKLGKPPTTTTTPTAAENKSRVTFHHSTSASPTQSPTTATPIIPATPVSTTPSRSIPSLRPSRSFSSTPSQSPATATATATTTTTPSPTPGLVRSFSSSTPSTSSSSSQATTSFETNTSVPITNVAANSATATTPGFEKQAYEKHLRSVFRFKILGDNPVEEEPPVQQRDEPPVQQRREPLAAAAREQKAPEPADPADPEPVSPRSASRVPAPTTFRWRASQEDMSGRGSREPEVKQPDIPITRCRSWTDFSNVFSSSLSPSPTPLPNFASFFGPSTAAPNSQTLDPSKITRTTSTSSSSNSNSISNKSSTPSTSASTSSRNTSKTSSTTSNSASTANRASTSTLNPTPKSDNFLKVEFGTTRRTSSMQDFSRSGFGQTTTNQSSQQDGLSLSPRLNRTSSGKLFGLRSVRAELRLPHGSDSEGSDDDLAEDHVASAPLCASPRMPSSPRVSPRLSASPRVCASPTPLDISDDPEAFQQTEPVSEVASQDFDVFGLADSSGAASDVVFGLLQALESAMQVDSTSNHDPDSPLDFAEHLPVSVPAPVRPADDPTLFQRPGAYILTALTHMQLVNDDE